MQAIWQRHKTLLIELFIIYNFTWYFWKSNWFQNMYSTPVLHSEHILKSVAVGRKELKKDWCSNDRERKRANRKEREKVTERLISATEGAGSGLAGTVRASCSLSLKCGAWPLIASTCWIHQDPAANHWLRSTGPCSLAAGTPLWSRQAEPKREAIIRKGEVRKNRRLWKRDGGTFLFPLLLEKPGQVWGTWWLACCW